MAAEPDFLTRWSQRKAAARRGGAAAPEPEMPAPENPALAETTAVEAPAAEPPPLPDPATLVAESDFRAFLAKGVPGDLRRAALRRLWRVNPIINSLDGLDDHYVTQDFTDAATVVPGLRTAYRVGRTMLDVAKRLEKGADADPTPRAAEAPEPAGEPAETDVSQPA